MRTVYKGASPQVTESQITQPIEDSISGIEGVRTVKSVSREEVSQITVEFVPERDVDSAANDVRDRVARVRALLPEASDESVVSKIEADAQAILWLDFERQAFVARAFRLRRPHHRRQAEDAARRRLGDHRRRAALRDAHLAGGEARGLFADPQDVETRSSARTRSRPGASSRRGASSPCWRKRTCAPPSSSTT